MYGFWNARNAIFTVGLVSTVGTSAKSQLQFVQVPAGVCFFVLFCLVRENSKVRTDIDAHKRAMEV